jgi:uncharacterized damage-inducible protein DinB
MSIESEFIEASVSRLRKSMERIEACVPLLTEAQIWARDSENDNSVGNLLLHLRGNVTQWILSGVGGQADHRDRNREFAARSGAAGTELVKALRAIIEQAVPVIQNCPASRLLEQVQPQGYKVSVLSAIYHVVEHFTGHTFQIILLTKRFTGRDLGFYRHLKTTGRLETPGAAGGGL